MPIREDRERELDQLHEHCKTLTIAADSQRVIIIDLQVRVAQLETKEPVGRDEFEPIKRLVWGFVGTVLAVVLIAILAVVVNKSGASISSVRPL